MLPRHTAHVRDALTLTVTTTTRDAAYTGASWSTTTVPQPMMMVCSRLVRHCNHFKDQHARWEYIMFTFRWSVHCLCVCTCVCVQPTTWNLCTTCTKQHVHCMYQPKLTTGREAVKNNDCGCWWMKTVKVSFLWSTLHSELFAPFIGKNPIRKRTSASSWFRLRWLRNSSLSILQVHQWRLRRRSVPPSSSLWPDGHLQCIALAATRLRPLIRN